MELRNTLKNMFLNSLQADLAGIKEKLEDFDSDWLNFDESQVEKLKTLKRHLQDWNEILTTFKGA